MQSASSSTCFLGLDLYYADHARPLTTAGEELEDHDLSEVCDFAPAARADRRSEKQSRMEMT